MITTPVKKLIFLNLAKIRSKVLVATTLGLIKNFLIFAFQVSKLSATYFLQIKKLIKIDKFLKDCYQLQ